MLSPLASARALLEPALEPGDAWEDVEARLRGNTAQLWPANDCAMVTEIWGDTIHVWLGGGSLKGLLTLRPTVETWAKAVGCRFATINGRAGWARALKRHGYAPSGDELRKTL